jgi:hypothetical protein
VAAKGGTIELVGVAEVEASKGKAGEALNLPTLGPRSGRKREHEAALAGRLSGLIVAAPSH